ncbi:ATP-binding protein [Flaviaesturariibacter aridisoli]|uniref:histidine kinase n=1 Tax=Flaviaesturariibacter aridisoli TaxID=2545761 RepID=A0A4R4E1I3_9BACT|nr:ATP-binding protein [Flaviaesturariibacter aridisoli]TCZ72218.1 PAS domain-containing sensor histidine kinase [Flaviaesturariibacter aridisoli]
MTFFPEIFAALPNPYLFIEAGPDFRILAANDAYLAVSGQTDRIIGQPLFSVFPGNSDEGVTGARSLQASLEAVLRERSRQDLPLIRYDTRSAGDSPFTERYWRVHNLPVSNKDGALLGILHGVEEVTTQVLLYRRMAHQDDRNQEHIRNAVLTTQEVERMEISQELHDNVGQILHTARLYLEKAQLDPERGGGFLPLGHELVVKAIGEVKELSQTLLHSTQDEKMLTASLEELLANVTDLKEIQVTKTFDLPSETFIESKVKTTVLRILQEQLTNVIRHSEARHLRIGLHFKDGRLQLTVQDDGKGFDPAHMVPGFGMRSMKSRVAMVDGSLDIDSRPGDGCTIRVSIPARILS